MDRPIMSGAGQLVAEVTGPSLLVVRFFFFLTLIHHIFKFKLLIIHLKNVFLFSDTVGVIKQKF